MARTVLYTVLLALASPWLYDRYLSFSAILANRPGKWQEVYNIKSHDVEFEDRLSHCEDVVLDQEKGLAILSCSPGRDQWNTVMGTLIPREDNRTGQLWVLDYATSEPTRSSALNQIKFKDFPNAHDFQPLGIEYDPSTSTLYATNHQRHSSVIEVFNLDLSSLIATHKQTFSHPLVPTPNSILVLGDGKLLVTIDHYFPARFSRLLSIIETVAGIPIGSVVYVDVNEPSATRRLARLPFANGIVRLNDSTVAVASSSKAGVYFYDLIPSYDLVFKKYIRVPAGIDNLSLDAAGKLLMSGHPYSLQVIALAAARGKCVTGDEKECECNAPSWAAEWSEEGGLKELYKSYGFCCSSMVVRDVKRGVGMISSLYGKGIMFFKE